MRDQLLAAGEQLAELLDTRSSVPIVAINTQQQISDCNSGFLKIFSLTEKPLGADLADFLISSPEGSIFMEGRQEFTCNPKTGVHGILVAHRLPHHSGLMLWCERLLSTNNQVVEQMALLNNEFIALQRELDKKNHSLEQTRQDLEEKVRQLEQAISQIKQLEGIIPICMYCKSIRDDKELWQNIELYIMKHSEAEFSHGICPVCFEKHFGLDNQSTVKE